MPPSKALSDLTTQQQSFETFKKKAELFLKDFKKSKKLLKTKTREEVTKYSDQCQDLLQELETISEEVENIQEEEEDTKKKKSFDSKKKHLVGKITSLHEQLSNVLETVSTTLSEQEGVDKVSSVSVGGGGKKDLSNNDGTNTTEKEHTGVKKSLSAKVRDSFKFDRSKKKKKDEEKEGKNDDDSQKVLKDKKPELSEKESKKDDAEDEVEDFEDDDIEEIDGEESDEENDDDDEEEDGDDDDDSEEDSEEDEGVVAAKLPASETQKTSEKVEKKVETANKGKIKVDPISSDTKPKMESKTEDSKEVTVKKPFLQKFLKRKTTETKPKDPDPATSTPKIKDIPKNAKKATVMEEKTEKVETPLPTPRSFEKKKAVEEKQIPLIPIESEKKVSDIKKPSGMSAPASASTSGAGVKSGKMGFVEEEEEEDEEEETESESEEEEEVEEEEEEGEEEEGEEEEEEEEEEEDDMDITGKQFIALQHFEKQEESDLPFRKNQVLTILRANEDGWWDAMDTSGNKGLVPKTYLRLYPALGGKDESEEDDDDGEEEEEEDEEDDDDEEEEDDDEDDDECIQSVPAPASVRKSRSGKKLWKSLKESARENSIIDVLHAMGAVPSGFRPSTLFDLYHKNQEHRMSNSLHPNLSTSALNFKDLFYSPSDNKIRPYSVNVQRIVTLLSCRYIPAIGAGLEVTNRTVRVCLFDGKNVLSNIHVIKASSVDKAQKTWNFSSTLSNNMDVSQHAEIFVRTNHTGPNIGLLFELGISYIRKENQENGEFSSGWHFLVLNDENVTLPNQNYDLNLRGGTPYERGVLLDATAAKAMEDNTLRNMIYGHQKPMLSIKVANPKREMKEHLDCLPETIIGNLSLVQFYSVYRNILAKALLWDRPNIDNTELLHSPILSTFPLIADQYDLMQLLRDTWTEKQREPTRGSKRDDERNKKLFIDTFMEAVYPMSHSLDILGSNSEAQRYDMIQKFKNLKRQRQSALAILLSEDIAFEPLDLEEITFSILRPLSLQDR